MLVLTDQEVRHKINEIISGKRLLQIEEQVILFTMPSCTDRLNADIVYDASFFQAVKEGIPPRKEFMARLLESGAISAKDFEKIQEYGNRINTLKLMASRTRSEHQRAETNRKIHILEEKRRQIEHTHRLYESNCAEAKAEQCKTLYIAQRSICRVDGSLFWRTEEEFENYANQDFQNNVISEFLEFAKGFGTTVMRYIVRHQEWRIFWRACVETHSPLFDGPTTSWDVNKLLATYWSNFYDNIYKHPNAPGEEIINDDIRCDKWIEDELMGLNQHQASPGVQLSQSKNGVTNTRINVAEPYRVLTQAQYDEEQREKMLIKKGE